MHEMYIRIIPIMAGGRIRHGILGMAIEKTMFSIRDPLLNIRIQSDQRAVRPRYHFL